MERLGQRSELAIKLESIRKRHAFKMIRLKAEEVAKFYNLVAVANLMGEKFGRRWAENATPKVFAAMKKYTEYRRKKKMQV